MRVPGLFHLLLLLQAVHSLDNCPETKPDRLNVHLVPHTHDDVGWLKTVDEYFYGSNKKITPVGVQYILDSVVTELIKDPKRRFIYVEMAFFFRWWDQQHDIVKHQVRQLVKRGQLEFILGGWCMNDEAAIHYNAAIDQMTWGLKRLNDTFGPDAAPSVAWQIDPFGHSREQANIFAQMGFQGLFFGRLDYADKAKRLKERTMEMIWKGSDSLGKSSWIFTGALYNCYSPPKGFCFDAYCSDDPIMDDPRLHDYNVDQKVAAFTKAAEEQAEGYNTNHIIMTMGEDFNYVQAGTWFKNLDKLIYYVNKENKINAIYSTPSCYLKSVHAAGRTYVTKTDDFLPYASDEHSYWTGYFTSRPTLKFMVRQGNNWLQACKQLDAVTNREWTPGIEGDVDVMRRAMAVLQHHDAVTGTSKQAVADDYAERLAEGFTECQKVISHAYEYLTPSKKEKNGAPPPRQHFCTLLNQTQCEFTEKTKDAFVVNVYNPLTKPVQKFVRLPVRGKGYEVLAPNGDSIVTQLVPIPARVKLIPGRQSIATKELVFKADLPALGFKSFYVKCKEESVAAQQSIVSRGRSTGRMSLFTDERGLRHRIALDGGFAIDVDYGYYEGHRGNNSIPKNRASGAYIFRPTKETPRMLSVRPDLVVRGPLVDELHLEFSPYITQVSRLYKGSAEVEVEWLVGPIPVSDDIGKEIVVRYSTQIPSAGKFYTDANGRQMLERVRNRRPTWKLNLTEPVSSNYYPANSRAALVDPKSGLQFTVLTDRSQGVTSMNDGQLEFMVHRRLLDDDAFGVGEALNEVAFGQGLVVRGKHWLQVGSAAQHRMAGLQVYMDAIVSFSETGGRSFAGWKEAFLMTYSALGSVLPPNVHLLTLEEWHGNSRDGVLIRLEHFFQAGEEHELSKPVTFSIKNLFAEYNIARLEEVTLGANLRMGERDRMEWKTDTDNDINVEPADRPVDPLLLEVTLSPMQIRTFVVDLETKYPSFPVG